MGVDMEAVVDVQVGEGAVTGHLGSRNLMLPQMRQLLFIRLLLQLRQVPTIKRGSVVSALHINIRRIDVLTVFALSAAVEDTVIAFAHLSPERLHKRTKRKVAETSGSLPSQAS